jgi:beta-galactosidase GanA
MFTVHGKPFFPLGGQSHNSSAYNADEIASAIAGVLALGGNTLEAPVYWEQFEPEEGSFDTTAIDELLAACRDAGLRLVPLWFGTWKNGEMRYVPEWVKLDTTRFPRVTNADGTLMNVLSSYGAATLAADKTAFAALCAHIARVDAKEETVIAVQVENEPGILGSDRDYGEAAKSALEETVPGELISFIAGRSSGAAYEAWQSQGEPASASWLQAFGDLGYELREAWSIASYINAVAEAGKKELDRIVYTNAWLGSDGWQVPGFYPTGGPIAQNLDVWKVAAPALACLAPDIYTQNFARYAATCRNYHRDDNELFVPESSASDANAMTMLHAIAEHDAIGYACFAIDSVLDLEGNLRDRAALFAASFRSVRSMIPLLLKYRGTGRIHAVVTEEGARFAALRFERYRGMIPYGDMGLLTGVTDHRHNRAEAPNAPQFGLVVEAGPHEFYLAGKFHLHMVPNRPPAWRGALRFPVVATPPDFLSVEEGYLEDDGTFVATRKRNGDEVVFGGFWAEPDVGVVRLRLTPY